MDPDDPLLSKLIIIGATVALSAFFSGMEIAFAAANKAKIEVERKQGFAPSAIISYLIKNRTSFISTILFGNNLSLVIYCIVIADSMEPIMLQFVGNKPLVFAIQATISSFIFLFFAHFTPKAFFRNNSNLALNTFAIPISLSHVVFLPFAKLTIFLSHVFLRLFFGVKYKRKNEPIAFERADFGHFIDSAHKSNQHASKNERSLKILANALDFSEVKIRECYVPRTELVAVNVDDSIEVLKQKFFASGNSKILVFEGSIDNIIGYVHHSRMFHDPKSVKEMVKEAPIVPETMSAQKLLSIFIKKNKSLAVVVDEFGGTAGIVTIEDIMEEIFGEIEDEHDYKSGSGYKKISETEFEFSGRIEIDYVNEKYMLTIPTSDEYETIAGLLLHNKGNFPKVSESIGLGRYNFTVIEASPTRIERVRLKINADAG
jgi:CBS domain containing-hemolysin-like protein